MGGNVPFCPECRGLTFRSSSEPNRPPPRRLGKSTGRREPAKLLAVRLLAALAVVGLATAMTACGGGSGAPEAEVNVSTSPDSEAETAIATDASGKVLLVGASAQSRGERNLDMRAYSSTDAGRTWITSELLAGSDRCGHSDPVPAIAANGRQYMTFLVGRCRPTSGEALEASLDVYLATRATPAGPWSGTILTPRSIGSWTTSRQLPSTEA